MKSAIRLKLVSGVLLSASLALSACGGSGGGKSSDSSASPSSAASTVPKEGLPLSKDPQNVKITTVIVDGQTPSKDVVLWKDIEQQTNVHVDFQDVNLSSWNEKKGLLFASNDLPDAFVGNGILSDSDLLNYGPNGQLIPLENLIDQYAPNLKKAFQEYPDLKKQITASDGHIYAIPSFNDDYQNIQVQAPIFINKAWLDKVGMKPPTTTDEFEKVLLAFKNMDPNGNGKPDEIPLELGKNWSYFSYLMGSFGVVDNYNTHIALKNGKVIYSLVQPEYKDAINYFHQLYSEGLIDKEVFTQDDRSFGAKIKTVPRVVGVFENWRSTAWANKPEEVGDYIAIGPLKGPKGDSLWIQNQTGLLSRGSFAITKAAKNPALLMRWGDNLLADDNSIQMANAGRIGDYMEKTADGKLKLLRALDFNNPKENGNAPGNNSRITFVTNRNSKRLIDLTVVYKEKSQYDQLYEGHFTKDVFPNIFFSKDESQQIATLGQDINTYANSMYAKWIIEGGIDKDWDAYVKKLNDMGLKDLLATYQKAYDRYNTSK